MDGVCNDVRPQRTSQRRLYYQRLGDSHCGLTTEMTRNHMRVFALTTAEIKMNESKVCVMLKDLRFMLDVGFLRMSFNSQGRTCTPQRRTVMSFCLY